MGLDGNEEEDDGEEDEEEEEMHVCSFKNVSNYSLKLSETGSGEYDDGVQERPQSRPVGKESKKKLVNQFNFCEHATQTYNNSLRVRKMVVKMKPT